MQFHLTFFLQKRWYFAREKMNQNFHDVSFNVISIITFAKYIFSWFSPLLLFTVIFNYTYIVIDLNKMRMQLLLYNFSIWYVITGIVYNIYENK